MHNLVWAYICLSLAVGVGLLCRDMRPYLATRPPAILGAVLFGSLPLGLWLWVQADKLGTTGVDWSPSMVLLPFVGASAFCGYWLGLRCLRHGWIRYLLEAIAGGLALVAIASFLLDFHEILSATGGLARALHGAGVIFIVLMPWCLISSAVLRIVANWAIKATAREAAMGDARTCTNQVANGKETRRPGLAAISTFVAPLLLCAPAVLMLHHDTNGRRNANTILTQGVHTIDAQIADIKDLNRVRSRLLARKQIVEELENRATREVNALRIFGRLPSGVQLLSLETRLDHVSLVVRCAIPSGESNARELAVLELLARSGYHDLKIAARQRDRDSDVQQLTFEASATRSDAE